MNPKNKPPKPTGAKPSKENNFNSFSTVSAGSIEQFSDYISADGTWQKYMAEISRRSGIGESTLYRSLHLTRKTLKNVLRNRTEED
jgi:hypothetical protein